MSLTPHPDKDELIMFGGEYLDRNKVLWLTIWIILINKS